jgi:hypothetical protein
MRQFLKGVEVKRENSLNGISKISKIVLIYIEKNMPLTIG